ncbi:Hypothetical predicted protein [Cloeon dipterum]|uniref:DUF4774 domain-containing protein n=1 Tax=Cloeon dipterum TaxID=197152 RepID=A0A8S1DA13_9INSE|nr:Hypothetical predicted protein [Cloeon dipterum]
MQSLLVAFSLLVGASLAVPDGYGNTGGVYPGDVYVAVNSTSVAVPSQDTSRGLPHPVHKNTPEVNFPAQVTAAKANFAAEHYPTTARAAVASPVMNYPYAEAAYLSTPVVAVESRHKRDLRADKTSASTTIRKGDVESSHISGGRPRVYEGGIVAVNSTSVAVPSQDTSRGLPQPVHKNTPEDKATKQG